MRWAVVAPFFETQEDRWISDAVEATGHSFTKIPRVGVGGHRARGGVPARGQEWIAPIRQARAAEATEPDGTITVFPKLAAVTGLTRLATRSDRPLVSWFFSTESLTSRPRRSAARLALSAVDRFVVHSTREIGRYSKLLGLPSERFAFVPLQYGATIEQTAPSQADEPYVFATGSGYRDYQTMFRAVEGLGYRTLVMASPTKLRGMTIPANVEIIKPRPRPEIRRLIRHARVNVMPLTGGGSTPGLVTIVETFRHGRGLVITGRPGLEDYVFEGTNALTPTLHNVDSMATAIEAMWSDDGLRHELDSGALRFANDNLTDAVAARHLVRILDQVT